MRVPRVSLCACIYGGALAGVTKHVRASCVGDGGGGGGRGWCVKACLCVGRAGVSRRAWGGGEAGAGGVYGLTQWIGFVEGFGLGRCPGVKHFILNN